MIKIRVWYEGRLYYHVDYVTTTEGRLIVKLLGENAIYFSPNSQEAPTIMLGSGLKDKIGNDIWEGDIVEFYYKGKNERCEVVFTDGLFCLKWKDGYINKYTLNPNNYKVVGNIFESLS